VESFLEQGHLAHPGGAPIQLARGEGHAWRVAHRQWDDPVVLFVDAARARRDGVYFERTRAGHFLAKSVPIRHVLNLRDGFAEQASAGGFLVDWSTGAPRIALIRVARRGGSTWEVAKGKIEAGEAPQEAAIREVREEMGLVAALQVHGEVGTIRYGFCTPDGAPRLKTIYLYVLEAHDAVESFDPARREGIDAVRWFALEEALASLAHPSLRASIGRLLGALEERAAELGVPMGVTG
jgi:8-oxo-dGTP pyrophosphatase MutT (NUDIX family)